MAAGTRRFPAGLLAAWTATRLLLLLFVLKVLVFPGPDVTSDVSVTYQGWYEVLRTGTYPLNDVTWQYPPAAALAVLSPELLPFLDYATAFFVLALLADLVVLALLLYAGTRTGRSLRGAWVWVAGVALLGPTVYARYDVMVTAVAVAALLAGTRHPRVMGALAAFGALLKVWPVLLLLGVERVRGSAGAFPRRSVRALGVPDEGPRSGATWALGRCGESACRAAWGRARTSPDPPRKRTAWLSATVTGVTLAALFAVTMPGAFAFLTFQRDRGTEVESLGALVFHMARQFGWEGQVLLNYGSVEFLGPYVDVVSAASVLLSAAGFGWLVLWRVRAGRFAPYTLAEAAFVAVLMFTTTSRVISPQYMVWLVGLAAVCLCFRGSRMGVPACLVLAACLLTVLEFPVWFDHVVASDWLGVLLLFARNGLLVIATLLAGLELWEGTVGVASPSASVQVPVPTEGVGGESRLPGSAGGRVQVRRGLSRSSPRP